MKIALLDPKPNQKRPFRLNQKKFVPAHSGCYALTNFENEILYIGLTLDLQRRFGEHLGDPSKTEETKFGRAILFHWLHWAEVHQLERTWMNIHIQSEGCLPVLNKKLSPTYT